MTAKPATRVERVLEAQGRFIPNQALIEAELTDICRALLLKDNQISDTKELEAVQAQLSSRKLDSGKVAYSFELHNVSPNALGVLVTTLKLPLEVPQDSRTGSMHADTVEEIIDHVSSVATERLGADAALDVTKLQPETRGFRSRFSGI